MIDFEWIPRFSARALGRGGAVTRLRTPTPVVDEIFFRRFAGGSAATLLRIWRRRFEVCAASSASDHTIFSPSVGQLAPTTKLSLFTILGRPPYNGSIVGVGLLPGWRFLFPH